MTVALYARRKGWPLTGMTVRLRHSRVHAEDCAECETKQAMLDRIEREITVAGELTKEQRTKVLEIAGPSRQRSTFERPFFKDVVQRRAELRSAPTGHYTWARPSSTKSSMPET